MFPGKSVIIKVGTRIKKLVFFYRHNSQSILNVLQYEMEKKYLLVNYYV